MVTRAMVHVPVSNFYLYSLSELDIYVLFSVLISLDFLRQFTATKVAQSGVPFNITTSTLLLSLPFPGTHNNKGSITKIILQWLLEP